MSESPQSSSNVHEIAGSPESVNAALFKDLLALEFGLGGETPDVRAQQLKHMSSDGVAMLIERVNALARGSDEAETRDDRAMRIGDHTAIAPESRHEVFTDLITNIQNTPTDTSPARVGDALALGIVLLHPFTDGNGRTARLIGSIFREEFDSIDYKQDFDTLIESRDVSRVRGGFIVNSYVPRFDSPADQSDPSAVTEYLYAVLTKEAVDYTAPYGPAPLHT